MKTINRYFSHWKLLAVAMTAGITLSCSDEWDSHYDGKSGPALTLWETIDSNPELKEFAALLKQKGYDKYLKMPQRYTVWAPKGAIDTTLVTGELMNSEEVIAQVVQNHIARSLVLSSSIVNDTILVLNGKHMPFVVNSSGISCFNGAPLVQQNIECSNGILHIMDAQAGYNNNIWSYLKQDNDFSMIADYLYSFNKLVFDPDASTVGGVVNGEKVYSDSVFILSNDLWPQIGYLNRESADYTMLVPTNDAWEEMVGEYKMYYNYPEGESAANSEVYASREVVRNLVFDMKSQKYLPDYWLSTGNKRFYQPYAEGGIFSDVSATIACSNGRILKSPALYIEPYETFVGPIIIEAEYESIYLVDKKNCSEDDLPVFVTAANTGISNSRYMKFTPSSTVLKPTVTYALPNVLSCSYDIGVVFVPLNLTRNGWMSNIDPKASRVTFELTDENISDRTERTVKVENVDIQGDKVDTVWVVKGHTFPYCDYYPERESALESKVSLKMTNEVRRSETSTHTRNMYIDCIVLKPTKEGASDEN